MRILGLEKRTLCKAGLARRRKARATWWLDELAMAKPVCREKEAAPPPPFPLAAAETQQPGNLNDAMRVLQLKVPLVLRYSVVYQNVQSSVGSTAMLL